MDVPAIVWISSIPQGCLFGGRSAARWTDRHAAQCHRVQFHDERVRSLKHNLGFYLLFKQNNGIDIDIDDDDDDDEEEEDDDDDDDVDDDAMDPDHHRGFIMGREETNMFWQHARFWTGMYAYVA